MEKMDFKNFSKIAIMLNILIIGIIIGWLVAFFVQTSDLRVERQKILEFSKQEIFELPNPSFEDGLPPWVKNYSGTISIAETPVSSGKNSAKLTIESGDPIYSGLTFYNSIKLKVDSNSSYLFSAKIFIPKNAKIEGQFILTNHVIAENGCSTDNRGCRMYDSIDADPLVDSNSEHGKWLTKFTKFRPHSDGKYFIPYFISEKKGFYGTFYIDDLKLEKIE